MLQGPSKSSWKFGIILLEDGFQGRNIREGFKTPSHGKCPLDFSVKLAKKLNGQGGYPPPPLTDAKSKKISPQAAFFGVFHPKNTVFDPKS